MVAIGDEVVAGARRNSNAEFLARRLWEMRIPVVLSLAVPDEPPRIADAIRLGLERAPVLVATGGLGPTADDVTREAVAEALGLPLAEDETALRLVEEAFARTGRTPTAFQRREALLPAGAEALPNPVGTAPGFIARRGAAVVVALPGVPAEMRAIFEESVAARLAPAAGPRPHVRLRAVGIPEAEVDERLRGALQGLVDLRWGLYTGAGEVEVLLSADVPEVVEAAEEAARAALEEYVYGEADETLAGVVGRSLADRGLTIGVAESCTAGMVAARIADVPGASAYLKGGVVAYANEAKTGLLAVPREAIDREGAVSAAVAEAMARGVRAALGADLGLAVTGIAGPTGATPMKPVGLVFVALETAEGTVSEKFLFGGDRATVRARAATAALNMVRRYLLQAG